MSFLDWFKRKPKKPLELPASPVVVQVAPSLRGIEVKATAPKIMPKSHDAKGDFAKGNLGGPGRPRIPISEKLATVMTQKEFARISQKFSEMTKEEIKELYQDPDSTALETAMAKIWHVTMAKGDERKMDFILNRMIGKVKDVVHVQEADVNTDKYKKALARLREIKEAKNQ